MKSQQGTSENPEKEAHSENNAATGAAGGSENALLNAGLLSIIQAWPELDDSTRARILAIIDAARNV